MTTVALLLLVSLALISLTVRLVRDVGLDVSRLGARTRRDWGDAALPSRPFADW